MALAPTDIKVAGHWKSVDQPSIKIVGHWKPVGQIMEKVAGHWKHIGGTLHPPLFTGAIGDLTAVVGEAFTKDVSPLFSTGPVPASYSLNNTPAGMVISNAGVISWPAPTKLNVSGISVTATNAGGFAVSDAFGVSAIALGPEIITNGTFDTNIDHFTSTSGGSTIAWSANDGGVIEVTKTSSPRILDLNPTLIVANPTPIGDYLVSWDQKITTGTQTAGIKLMAALNGKYSAEAVGDGHFNLNMVLTKPEQYWRFYAGTHFVVGSVIEIDNISIREVLP